MSLREKLNKNPAISAIAAIVLIVGAIALAVWATQDNPGVKQEYFALEDGTGLVALPVDEYRGYTIEYDGKTYYRAAVFECGEGGERKVAFLERYPPQFEAIADQGEDPGIPGAMSVEQKRPNETEWVAPTAAIMAKGGPPKKAAGSPTAAICPPGTQPIRVSAPRG